MKPKKKKVKVNLDWNGIEVEMHTTEVNPIWFDRRNGYANGKDWQREKPTKKHTHANQEQMTKWF